MAIPSSSLQQTPDFIPHVDETPDFIPHIDSAQASPGGGAALARGGPSPQGAVAPTPSQADQAARIRHARSTAGRVQEGSLTPEQMSAGAAQQPQSNWLANEGDWTESLKGTASGLVERLGGGMLDYGKELLKTTPIGLTVGQAKGKTPTQTLHDVWNSIITTPLEQQEQRAQETTGVEAAAHRLASYIPVFGPMAAGAGETMGHGDPGGAVDAIFAMEGAKAPFKKAALSDAAKSIQRMGAINDGKVRVVNGMVRQPLNMLRAKVNAEIGASVDHVLSADAADQMAKGSQTGLVNTLDAANAARTQLDKIGGMDKFPDAIAENKIAEAATGAHDLRSAKSLLTDTQRQAAALARQGRDREASVMWTLAKGLEDATQKRADEVGGGKDWSHYKNETRALKQHEAGLMGDLLNQEHGQAAKTLINPDKQTELNEIKKFMDKYGVDSTSFTRAVEMSKQLDEHTQQIKNAFVGKLRAIMKYPVAAGGAAAGASIVGHASGIPGMGFVLPLIVAGKVAGMLDNATVMRLLKEAGEKTVPQDIQIHEQPQGPMTRVPLQPPGGPPTAGAASTTPPKPSTTPPTQGQANPLASVGDLRVGGERRVAPGGGYEGLEQRKGDRRTQAQADYEEAISSTRPGERTAGEELAEKVRQTKAAKAGGGEMSEGEAIQQLMRDPSQYAKWRQLKMSGTKADEKIADAMLVDVVRGARK